MWYGRCFGLAQGKGGWRAGKVSLRKSLCNSRFGVRLLLPMATSHESAPCLKSPLSLPIFPHEGFECFLGTGLCTSPAVPCPDQRCHQCCEHRVSQCSYVTSGFSDLRGGLWGEPPALSRGACPYVPTLKPVGPRGSTWGASSCYNWSKSQRKHCWRNEGMGGGTGKSGREEVGRR